MRAHYQVRIVNTSGATVTTANVRLCQPGTGTNITQPVYATSTGSAITMPVAATGGVLSLYTDVAMRVRVGVTVAPAAEVFFDDIDILVPTEDRLSSAEGRLTVDEANIASLNTAASSLSSRVSALEAAPGGGGGSVSFAQLGVVPLDSFTGANDDAKMANALSYISAQTYKPTLVLANRTHTFANNYPLTIKGFRMSGPLGGMEREFSVQCKVNVTGTSLFSVDPTATASVGAKDFSIRGITFSGNGSNYFLAPVTDLTAGPILVDATFRDGGWINFKTVMQARHLRVNIEKMYTNAGTDTQFYLAGSDNNYWVEGQSFLSAVAMTATQYYIRFAHMSRTTLGAVYITPQVSTGVRIEGSYGDLYLVRTKFDGAGRTTSTTWQQGPAIQITGGNGISIVDCEFFNTAVAGASTKGIIQIQGGSDHLVDGCTFIGGSQQTSSTPTTRPAIYTTGSVKVRNLTAPNGHQKILQQSVSGLILNDDTTWTVNTAA
jgi:hypothetical protein